MNRSSSFPQTAYSLITQIYIRGRVINTFLIDCHDLNKMEIINTKKLAIKTNDKIFALDSNYKSADLYFLSHAHSDHLIRTKNKVLCTKPTEEISKMRGYSVDRLDNADSIQLLDNGHILGSVALLIEGEERILFTGDFSLRDRSFMKGFKPVKSDILIIESTFGSPIYVFPDQKEEEKRARDYIEDNLKKGYATVIMGYPLGKSQELQYLFNDYNKYIDPKIVPYNEIYKSNGIKLINEVPLEKSDIIFCPTMKSSSPHFNRLKREKGVKFAVFSGWNIRPYYKRLFGADEGFTLSDHADFRDLLYVVHKTKAKKIIVHHGLSREFVNFLKKEGYDAYSLTHLDSQYVISPS